MKKVLYVMIIASLFVTACVSKVENKIVRTTTDDQGLTSIEFVQDGQVWALDYLTAEQVDSLKTVLFQ